MPTSLCGLVSALAISVKGMLEVFVASMASGFAFCSISLKSFCLASTFSNMASMMMSAFRMPSPFGSMMSRSLAAAMSKGFFSFLWNVFWARL